MRGRLERPRCFYAEHGSSVLFSAALSIVLEHVGLLAFLKKISVLPVAALASQGGDGSVPFASGAPAVVMITETEFVNRYGERSPLDRCVLAGDIEKVLAKSSPTSWSIRIAGRSCSPSARWTAQRRWAFLPPR